MKKKVKVRKDRLSSLPESLLPHILSFLDIHAAFETRFLSKAWKHVWSSAPVLKFDNSLQKSIPNTGSFVYFVDRFLHFRNNSTTIPRITFSHEYCYDHRRLATWLFIALKQHVKEIHLTIGSNNVLPYLLMPLFTSQIEVVNLSQTFALNKVPVQPMKWMCSAPKFRTLELANIALPEGDSSGKLILSFPVLENMILKQCPHAHVKVLQISALRLKALEIKNKSDIKDSCSIELSTPNLESLQLRDSYYCGYSLGNLSSLTTANIGVQQTTPLMEVLHILRNVTTLELFSPCQLKTYVRLKKRFGQSLRLFSNLKRLILSSLHCGSCIGEMAILLNSAPCIETLAFSLSMGYNTENDKEDSVRKLKSGYSFRNLQNVRLLHSAYSQHELHILAFFLKNAKTLKNITIRAPVYKPIQWEEFSKKLHSVPKASSNVIQVHFMTES